MSSSFARRLDVEPVDSTQRAVPPPPVAVRAVVAASRVLKVSWRLATGPKPDALLLFSSSGWSFFEKSTLVLIARLRGVPALLFIRGGRFMTDCRTRVVFRLAAGLLLRLPRALLCQGITWQRFYEQEFGIPPERCPIVENGTAPEDYLEIGGRRSEKGAIQVTTLVYAGWIERRKGIFDALNAMDRLVSQGITRVRLVVLGEGGDLDEARRLVASRQLSEFVEFAGWVSGEEKRDRLAGADIFLLPSHGEGLPNAMIEAMALGLPVVVTQVGSIPDVIEHGVNGILVPPENPEALSAALRVLVGDSALQHRLGVNAWNTARSKFTSEAAAGKLVSAVRTVAFPGGAAPEFGDDPDLHPLSPPV